MYTVFTPGLGQGLQLDIGRFTLQVLEVFLNGLHLDQVEEQILFLTQGHQLIIIEITNGPRYAVRTRRA